MDTQGMMKWFGNKSEESSGSLEFSVAGLFKCMCCTNPKDYKEDLHLLQIANSLEKLEKRLESLYVNKSKDIIFNNQVTIVTSPHLCDSRIKSKVRY